MKLEHLAHKESPWCRAFMEAETLCSRLIESGVGAPKVQPRLRDRSSNAPSVTDERGRTALGIRHPHEVNGKALLVAMHTQDVPRTKATQALDNDGAGERPLDG
jgi:hypothetical protein